jgi:rubrerythrin
MAAVPRSSPQPAERELRCTVCGYGAVVEQPPASCPICRSTERRPIPVRPTAPRAI